MSDEYGSGTDSDAYYSDDEQHMEEEEVAIPECAELKEEVLDVRRKFPDTEKKYSIEPARIEKNLLLSTEDWATAVIITIDIDGFPEWRRQAWELADILTISIVLDNVCPASYRNSYHTPKPVILKNFDRHPSTFTVGAALENFSRRFLEKTFHARNGEAPYLRHFYSSILERLEEIADYCFICGAELVQKGTMPTICDRPLCTYQYHELNVFDGSSIAPRVSSDVMALFIFAFNEATKSKRKQIAMDPPPSFSNEGAFLDEIAKYTQPAEAVETFRKGRSLTTAWPILAHNLPCPAQILSSAEEYTSFREGTPEIAKFVEWLIICSNAYIERLPPSRCVDFLKTDYQYLFVNDTKEKQADFERLVAENTRDDGKPATTFLFHGSPIGNWHSIMRRGLKNMSGTAGQANGAVHGNGIYASNTLQYSLAYSSESGRLEREACGLKQCCLATTNRERLTEEQKAEDNQFVCVALVEVVDSKLAVRNTSVPEIWVITDERYCTIRMLLLYKLDTAEFEGVNGVYTHVYNNPDRYQCQLNKLTDEQRQRLQEASRIFRKARQD